MQSPLGPFAGAVPPAPPWFTAALAHAPEASRLDVGGTGIELLTWGACGRPGLLLLHGNGAHAGWWRFIAPFFAATHRVAALSWAGMGGSDHRERYTLAGFIAEAQAGAAAAGLFDAGPPVAVGHSFGGFPMMAMVADDDRWGAAVVVDTPFREPGEAGGRPPNATNRPHRVYPTLAAALARFRFAPLQGCEHPFIADHIARGSLLEVAPEHGGGWTWRFDPYVWTRFEARDDRALLAAAKCPVALIWGERSQLMPPARVARMRAALPPESPAVAIPDADHHVMVDQPLAFVGALRGLLAGWPR